MSENSSTEGKSRKPVKTILRDNNNKDISSIRSRACKKKEYGQNSIKERSHVERTNREGKFKEHNLSKRSNPDKFRLDTLGTTPEEEPVTNRGSRKKTEEKPGTPRQIGYGKDYHDLIEKHETKFVFPPGSPIDVRVSRGMIICDLPETMRDRGLDLGDWITAINGEPVTNRTSYTVKLRKLWGECKEKLEITYKIDRLRMIQQIKNPQECQAIHQAYEINPGCDYLFAILSLFPGSSLGLSIKSFSGKIFVSSVDNGFKSLAMRTFLVGDAILSVNGQTVSSVSEADQKIITELKTKKPVKFVVERAVSPAAVFNVKLALGAEKTVELNPRLMNDVIDICQQELTRMDNNKDCEQLRSILREKKKKQGSAQLTFSDASSETSIGMDPVNPIFLAKAPPRPSAESCRGKKIPRR